jgi:magnesium-transporting ATPase (P-type)
MKLNSITLQQGIAAGGLIIVLQLTAYLMGVETFMSSWLSTGRFILIVLAMVLTCLAVRKEEGSLTFKRAVLESWIAGGLASLIGVLFMIVIFTFDDQLGHTLANLMVAEFDNSLGSFAGSFTDEMRTEMEGQMKWVNQPLGQMVGWAVGLIFWLLASVVLGAIFKRPAPDSIR